MLKKLHVAAIFVSFFQALKSFFIPILVSLFLGNAKEPIGFFRFEYIWILMLLFIFFAGIIQWSTFRYQLRDGELYVQKGLFIKKKRYIQKKRIQSIDIKADFFQRLFGLVQLTIETAGGKTEPEVHLIAISHEEAEIIRNDLLYDDLSQELVQDNIVHEDGRDDYVWRLSTHRLFIAALTSSGIAIALSAVVALFSQIEQFLPESIFEQVFGWMTRANLIFLFIIFIVIILIAWSLSIMGTVIKYGRFNIHKSEDDLVISRGLIEKRQLTLQIERITAVRIVSNLFRQPFGYVSIYVESAGGGSADEQQSTVLFPLVKRDEVITLLQQVLPRYAFEYELTSIPKRARLRFFIRMGMIPLVMTCVFAYFTAYGLIGFVLVLLCLLLGYYQHFDSAYGLNHNHAWIRYRRISQHTVITLRDKIQAAEISISPFQKRKQLASFQFSIQSSIQGKTFKLVDISQRQAHRILQWMSREDFS